MAKTKTERQVIDELGEWLCTDIEKDIVKSNDAARIPPSADMEKIEIIKDIAKRIHWYKENCLDD